MEQAENITEANTPSLGEDKKFLQFITEQGWKYTAPCGCHSQMDK